MKRRGQTLAATLIVLVLIGMLAMVFMWGGVTPRESSRKDGLGTTIPGASMYKARDEACKSNLRQTRMAFEIASADGLPASLDEVKLSAEFRSCPIGKEAYTYDAAEGVIKCPHLGHEKY